MLGTIRPQLYFLDFTVTICVYRCETSNKPGAEANF